MTALLNHKHTNHKSLLVVLASAIEADARDPHFMANLGRLGQVKVDHHMETYRSSVSYSES